MALVLECAEVAWATRLYPVQQAYRHVDILQRILIGSFQDDKLKG